MIFLFPLLFIIFILLLILRLAGGHITWDEVLIPVIVLLVLCFIFLWLGVSNRRKRRQARDKPAKK